MSVANAPRKILAPQWRVLAHLLLCLPFIWLVVSGAINTLDPDPGKTLVHGLGKWGLRLLLLTLAITPLQRFTAVQWLPLRRTIGLYALTYAVLHLLAYIFFYLGVDFSRLAQELVKRPYIVVGALALLILMALGATSNRAAQRKLGRRWKLLHRCIYLAVIAVLVHALWQLKAGVGDVPLYALVFAVLMLLRWA